MTTAAIKATSVKTLANDQHSRQVGEGEGSPPASSNVTNIMDSW